MRFVLGTLGSPDYRQRAEHAGITLDVHHHSNQCVEQVCACWVEATGTGAAHGAGSRKEAALSHLHKRLNLLAKMRHSPCGIAARAYSAQLATLRIDDRARGGTAHNKQAHLLLQQATHTHLTELLSRM